MKNKLVLSGDQSVHWDALAKLAVLKRQGWTNVQHLVHSADCFGTGRDGPGLQADYLMVDGNLSQWAACIWAGSFLGRTSHMPDLQAYGIVLSKAQLYSGSSQADLVQELSRSDCFGVTLGRLNEMAETVEPGSVKKWVSKWSADLKADMEEVLGREIGHEEWYRIVPPFMHLTVGECCRQIMSGWTGGPISSSFEQFSVTHLDNFRWLIDLFTTPETVRLYNQTLGGQGILALQAGEIPFFVVIRGDKQSAIRSDEPLVSVGGMFEHAGNRFALDRIPEHIVALVPKALPLGLYLRRQGMVALPRHGSGYMSAVTTLGQSLGLDLNPILRVDFNALDRMAGLQDVINLPPYLHSFFGESVRMDELAREWRGTVTRIRTELASLPQLTGDERLDYLFKQGLIIPEMQQLLGQLRSRGETRNAALKGVYNQKLVLPPGLSKEDRTAAQLAQARANRLKRNQIDRQFHQPFLDQAGRFLEGYAHWALAQRVAHLEHVAAALEYWNDRPFNHWLKLVGGGQWFDQVVEHATLEISES